MHRRKYRFWQWIKSDAASIANSGVSSAVGSIVVAVLGATFSGFSGMLVGAIVGALVGSTLGYYLQKRLSIHADKYLRPYELLAEQTKKSREEYNLKRKAEQEKSNVEMYAVVYLGYKAAVGFYQFRRLDNNGVVFAIVKDFGGGIGIGDTLIFRRQRGSLYAVVEPI